MTTPAKAAQTEREPRYMRNNVMSLDSVAMVQLTAPDVLTAEELADVREWMEIKYRQWERIIQKREDAAAIGAQTERTGSGG